MQNKPIPWVAIALLSFNLVIAIFALLLSLLLAFSGIMQYTQGEIQASESSTSLSASAFLVAVLLMPGVYYGLMGALEKGPPKLPSIKIPLYVLILAWIACIGLGYLINNKTV
jgi:hypothetical protein